MSQHEQIPLPHMLSHKSDHPHSTGIDQTRTENLLCIGKYRPQLQKTCSSKGNDSSLTTQPEPALKPERQLKKSGAPVIKKVELYSGESQPGRRSQGFSPQMYIQPVSISFIDIKKIIGHQLWDRHGIVRPPTGCLNSHFPQT